MRAGLDVAAGADAPGAPDKDGLLGLYREMLLIRRTEEQLARAYQGPGQSFGARSEKMVLVTLDGPEVLSTFAWGI